MREPLLAKALRDCGCHGLVTYSDRCYSLFISKGSEAKLVGPVKSFASGALEARPSEDGIIVALFACLYHGRHLLERGCEDMSHSAKCYPDRHMRGHVIESHLISSEPLLPIQHISISHCCKRTRCCNAGMLRVASHRVASNICFCVASHRVAHFGS